MDGKNTKPLNILLVGPSGSGKGTQANMLAKKYNLKHLQSGKILRNISKEKTSFGKKVKRALRSGFVPSEWIFKIIEKEFEDIKEEDGLVLDSFSRLLPEAKMLYEALLKQNRKLDYAFLINISDEEARRRLMKRGECKKCGETFILDEKKDAVCEKCKTSISKRDDDNLGSIEKRLSDFRKKTSKSIDYIKKTSGIIEINGEQSISKVFKDIISNIESKTR